MQMNWAETPGGYYAIAYVLACGIMMMVSPRRYNNKISCLVLAGLGGLLFAVMTITQGAREPWFLILMIMFLMIVWAMIHILCEYNLITSCYFMIRAFILGEFIASFEFQMFYYLVKYHILPLTWVANIALVIVVDGGLGIFFYHLEKRNIKVNQGLQINNRELFSAIAIALAIYTASNLSYVFKSVRSVKIVVNQLFIIRTLMDLGGAAILFAYHAQLGELNMRSEVERLQDMLEMQQNNFEVLRQSVNVVDQKYHDLKYQISVLKSESNKEDSMRYLDQMEREIKAYEAQNKTGNKTLDIMLTGKSLYCQNNWIELTSVADGKSINFMDPMDISILFGNMLDNAIESVSKIENKEKRLIHLAIAKQKSFVRIRMENCYGEAPKIENGVIKTSKEDKKYHGFGMKSIQNVVKKYGGSTTIQAENGWFELRILIPIPDIKK